MKTWFSSIIEKEMVTIIQNHCFCAFINVEISVLQIVSKYSLQLIKWGIFQKFCEICFCSYFREIWIFRNYRFKISRQRASKWYVTCSHFRSFKFFEQPLWSYFAKIAHKIAKSKYFSNIYNESYSLLNSLSNDL